jgi:hypothetical protein
MSVRSLAGLLVLGLSLAPAACRADIRIEETGTTLNSTVKRWTFIKGEKRSIVTRHETAGVLYNAGARYGAYVEIARPDIELIWELEPQEKSYREIRADQFSRLLQKGIQAPRSANDQPLRTLYRSETTAIEVVPTGNTKRIAGYEAEEVVARVVVGAQNLVNGNRLSFTFDQKIWMTKDERILKEVRPFDEAYAEAFGSAATLQQARLLAGEWNDAFITHLRAVNDRVRALQGFPLSVTTTVTEEAIAQAKGEKSTKREFTVASMEVKRISLESIPESEFELPAGYINSDTKVAVAPKAAPPAETPAPTAVAAPAPAPVVARNPPPAPAPAALREKPKVEPVPVVAKAPAAPGSAATTTGETAPAAPGTPSAQPKPEPGPAVAANPPASPSPAPKPEEKPVVAAAPAPVVPDATVGTSRVPTNVRVPGGPAAPAASASAPVARNEPAVVPGGAPRTTASGPVVPVISSRQAVPPPVVIDEPEVDRKGKRKRR